MKSKTYSTFNIESSRHPLINPEETASLWSKLFISWSFPLIKEGHSRQLNLNDVWPLKDANKSDIATSRLIKQWKRKPTVGQALARVHGLEILGITFLGIGAYACDFFGPIALEKVIILLESSHLNTYELCIWLMALSFSRLLKSILFGQYNIQTEYLASRVIGSIQGLIYRKASRLNAKSKTEKTTGDIVNLYTSDSENILSSVLGISSLIILPMIITAVLWKLFQLVGYAALAGIGVIVISLIVNNFIAYFEGEYYEEMMELKDKRMKLINELFGSILIVKLNAWEKKFHERVHSLRNYELKILWKFLIVVAINISLLWGVPVFVSVLTFMAYSLVMKLSLTASKVFTCIALFRLLQEPLRELPNVIAEIIRAYVSIKRINIFCSLPERDPSNVIGLRNDRVARSYASKNIVIDICDGTFTWNTIENALFKDLNMSIRLGDLVVLHGKVASGKSSLCSILLGEMIKLNGTVFVGGKVAYCSQQPWIQNMTIRDNILFGSKWNSSKYKKVLDACGLNKDIELFKAGDQTEIGENGLNLSGGQKARISLARACYSDSDIYILDSPLAAVDAIVQNEIFNKCILGLLRNKTRLLISHSPEIINSKYVDRSIEISKGTMLFSAKGEQILSYVPTEVGKSKMLMHSPLPCHLSAQHERLLCAKDEHSYETDEKKEQLKVISSELECISPSPRHHRTSLSSQKQDGKLVSEERRHEGRTSRHVYWSYFRNIGGLPACVFLICVQIVWQILLIGSDLWLTHWTSEGDQDQEKHLSWNLLVYSILAIGSAFTVLTRTMAISCFGLKGAKRMFDLMTDSLLKAPMLFFDENPIGRILNRYAEDTFAIDCYVAINFGSLLSSLFSVLGTMFTAVYLLQYYGLLLLPVIMLYYLIASYFIPCARELQRIRKVSTSPMLSHVSESIQGLSTILAFGPHQLQRFIQLNEKDIDFTNACELACLVVEEWFAMRIRLLGGLILILFTVGVLALRHYLSPGIIGLIINYGLSVDEGLESVIRSWIRAETNIVSPERVQEYIDLTSEAPHYISSTEPPRSWPEKGEIVFQNVAFKYRKTGPYILKNLSFHIHSGEKVGIVGRTGAGKSSLTMALFRIEEILEGTMTIDSIDISSIGLNTLRSSMTIISQSPILFRGTIRNYLDPFDEYSDESLWKCLKKVGMDRTIGSIELKLNGELEENGNNFSVGERQLLCMSRALLSSSQIVVLDEATASMDTETDQLIQTVLLTEFKYATVLTIAHRLETIMDADRVMVMDAGNIIEFDTPSALIHKGSGHFYDLAKEDGILDRIHST